MMSLRLWIPVCVLLVLPSLVLCGIMMTDDYGDPWICTHCWIGGHHHHGREGSNPSGTLKTIYAAEQEFLKENPTGKHPEQYWRADISGLYALDGRDGRPIKLIELSTASADDQPRVTLDRFAVRSAKNRYWYRSILHAGEDPAVPDPHRFAFCVFPEPGSPHKYIYILDEGQRIFRTKAEGRRGIDRFPTEKELQASWSKVD
jgi:hypothetical protein